MSRFYEPVNGFTHLAGALLAALGLVWLMTLTWDNTAKLVTVIVYGVSMILCFSASTVLHLTQCSLPVRKWLTRADHASIYIMIAGTYTPFCYNVLTSEAWRWSILSLIWALALAGVLYKLFLYNKEHHLSTLSYVAMGWLAVVLFPQALHMLPAPILWLVIGGGVTYSVGAVIFALKKPNFHRHFGFHELWHLFVLGGSALHFVAVLLLMTNR
ncbi:MAG: hemolysin III family protein [Chloroflexi bacterium]|nr:hemolysin III family protein [Chloroflexota bacterium]